MVFILLLIFLLSTNFDFVSHHPPAAPVAASSLTLGVGASLSKFKSLEKALTNSKIVGIYFAASWCDMSTPVSNALEKVFSAGDSLQNRVLSNDTPDGEKKDLSIVYVSSDESEEDMKVYSRSNWINVPFESTDRNELKRHFRTCAQIEMEELGIDPRRFHIPTLLIIDSVTHGVLSTNGVDELEEYGTNVLDHWLQIQALTRGLEGKYEEE